MSSGWQSPPLATCLVAPRGKTRAPIQTRDTCSTLRSGHGCGGRHCHCSCNRIGTGHSDNSCVIDTTCVAQCGNWLTLLQTQTMRILRSGCVAARAQRAHGGTIPQPYTDRLCTQHVSTGTDTLTSNEGTWLHAGRAICVEFRTITHSNRIGQARPAGLVGLLCRCRRCRAHWYN